MTRFARRWLIGLGITAAVPILGLAGLSIRSRFVQPATSEPPPPGGRLAPCPESPNCVCSQDDPTDSVHFIEPLRWDGPPEEGLERLKTAAAQRFSGTVAAEEPGRYVRMECLTQLFWFVDDLEFLADPAHGVIHVRSASRVGRSDLGVNRARVETLRDALNK